MPKNVLSAHVLIGASTLLSVIPIDSRTSFWPSGVPVQGAPGKRSVC